MDGGGEHVDVVDPAPGGRPPLHRLEEGVKRPPHELVRPVVVVSVSRSLVQEHLAQGLPALEVGGEGFKELPHGEGPLLEDVVLYGREGIGEGPNPHPLDVGGVVPGPAGVVVLSLFDAVVDEDGKERRGHLGRIQPLHNGVPPDLDVDEMP